MIPCSLAKHCCQDLGQILILNDQSLLRLLHLMHHIDDFAANVDSGGGVHVEVEELRLFLCCYLGRKHFDVAAVVVGDGVAAAFLYLYSQSHPVSCIRRIQKTTYACLLVYPSEDNVAK